MKNCKEAVEKLFAIYEKDSKTPTDFQPSTYDLLLWMNKKIIFKGGKATKPNQDAKPVLQKLEVK